MHIVVAGCGRLGALLAGELSRLEHFVVIIDHAENTFDKLPGGFSGFKLTGDAAEHPVLEAAEIHKAACLFSVCREDTLNLMIAQLARHVFQVPRVFARVHQVAYEEMMSSLSIEIISPTRLALNACLGSLLPEAEVREARK